MGKRIKEKHLEKLEACRGRDSQNPELNLGSPDLRCSSSLTKRAFLPQQLRAPDTGEAGFHTSGCDPRDQIRKTEDWAFSHSLGESGIWHPYILPPPQRWPLSHPKKELSSLGSVGVLKKLGMGDREKKVALNPKVLLPNRFFCNDGNVLNLCCPIL